MLNFLLGFASAAFILLRYVKPLNRAVRRDATNIFVVIPLVYCHFYSDEHETPAEARITYNTSLLRWEAGCSVCVQHAYGDTPHAAASRWNEMALKQALPRHG